MKTSLYESLIEIYNELYKRYGPRHWWPGDTRIEIIIGAILTQNAAWTNVEKAIKNLKKQRVLNIRGLNSISKKRLARLIVPSGYYNIKAERIKNFLRFLNLYYNGSLDRMFQEDTAVLRKQLLNIKGIGPETADSILLYAGGRAIFVVDAYTKRIFSRHGYIREDDDYDKVQNLFLENLPSDARLFNEFHALIVEHGKELCKKKKPLCKICPIRRIKNA